MPLKIPVEQLTTTPEAFAFELGDGWWRQHVPRQPDLPDALAEPLQLEVRVHQQGEDVHLDGSVAGALDLECSRCLSRYRQRLREPFRLALEPAGQRTPSEPEARVALARDGLCLGDELETGWYRGGEIDLSAVCLELISLALPVKPLCSEDCPGLCPQCGRELASGSCGCTKTRSPSPFDALAALRDGGSRGVR